MGFPACCFLFVHAEGRTEFIHTMVKAALDFFIRRIVFFVDVSICRIWRHDWHSRCYTQSNSLLQWSRENSSTVKSLGPTSTFKSNQPSCWERATPQCFNTSRTEVLLTFHRASFYYDTVGCMQSPSADDNKECPTYQSVWTYEQIQIRQ